MVQNVVLVFLRRRLSQRPNVEELESRNILKREFRKILKNVFELQHLRFRLSSVRLKARTVKGVVHYSAAERMSAFFHLKGKHDFLCLMHIYDMISSP